MSNPQRGAFSDPGDFGVTPYGGQQGLASALAPLQAEITQDEDHWNLTLSPMCAFDAMRCIAGLSDMDEAMVLVYDVEHAASERLSSSTRTGASHRTLKELAIAHNIRFVESFEDDALALEPSAASELIGMLRPTRVRAALVNGPIETRDARDMVEAPERGQLPLDVELRAVASIEITSDRLVRLQARAKDDALKLVAENFRHYLAAVRRRSHNECSAPELWQLDRLFSVSGTLTVRPIETEIFTTSMDIGISTSPAGASRPADRSLIYDLPSDTWHDDP